MFFKYIKDAIAYQNKYGGTIWFDQQKNMYYIV